MMMRIPCTKVYVFCGIFRKLPISVDIPVIEHFRNVLKPNDIENFEVIQHGTATVTKNKILKIGFYRKKEGNSGENGADNSRNPTIIDMPPVINMRKRA